MDNDLTVDDNPTGTDHVVFYASDLQGVEGYKLITGLVVPRPIGWIGSLSPDGVNNLAPYSFFNAVSGDPPTVLFSAGHGPGVRKDSADNISVSGEFTVNIVTDELAEAMNRTSAGVAPEVDEFVDAGLTAVSGVVVGAPRVAEAKAQLECRVVHQFHVGRADGGNQVFVGEVVAFHVRRDLLDGTRVDQAGLRAVGRHVGNLYSRTHDLFTLVRPD
ncbi:MAG: flavin reductase family protein [Acidimicrobiia bacterium]|nr:flavin reductase family protein [Acidimicrobiia bacterium]